MSIVERALQKAQQQAKSGTSQDAPVATEAATQATAPSASETTPASAPAEPVTTQTSVAATETSPLGRDAGLNIRIDFDRLRADGRLPVAEMAEQTEHEIRRLKWPLLKAIAGHAGVRPARNNVILVTSAVPAEGKTFTSLNLALSIVRDREMRVVLVDGDVARPGLTPALGLEGRPGLNDAFDDTGLDVRDVTYQTDVEGLYFIPSGKWHEHSAEFFAGSRMEQVLGALSRAVGKGVIILDSPPLLATNDAQAATRYAGQVLLVVRADHTEQRAVQEAMALIDPATPVSAVLNRVEPSAISRYYGQYYYGYGYGRGSAQSRPGDRSRSKDA